MLAASNAWARELVEDPDRAYILAGVYEGFSIVDLHDSPPHSCHSNYGSTKRNHEKVEQTILSEIKAGNYVVCDHKPSVVSPLGVIPKPDSQEVRLIHDLSRGGVNALASDTSVSYPTLEDALHLMPEGAAITKIDLCVSLCECL